MNRFVAYTKKNVKGLNIWFSSNACLTFFDGCAWEEKILKVKIGYDELCTTRKIACCWCCGGGGGGGGGGGVRTSNKKECKNNWIEKANC